MLPISIKIEGFYSYQTLQTIDFIALYKNNIFGIFGPVGSGKSAILDAISLSLYGSVDRINNKERRNYNIVNLKSNKLYIEFTFKSDSQLYQFVVTAQRNKKNFEKIEDFEHKAYQKQNDKWVPIPLLKTNIAKLSEKILGLNYENFNRTIIIPQGKFQEFLKLSPSDRTTMLSDIFSLQKYDLYASVYTKYKETKEQYDKIEGKIENLKDYSKESLNTEESELNTYNANLKQVNQDISKAKSQEKIHVDILNLVNEHKQLKSNLAIETNTKEIFLEKQHKIDIYEHCQHRYKDLINSITNYNNDLLSKKIDYKNIIVQLETSKQATESLKIQLDRIEEIIKNKDKISQQIIELQTELELRKIAINIKELKKLLSDEEIKYHNKNSHIENLTKQISHLEEKCKEINSQIINQKIIDAIYAWSNHNQLLLQNLANLNEAKGVKQKELKDIEYEGKELINNHFPNYQKTYKNFEDLKFHLTQEYEQILKEKTLTMIYKNLTIGDPCPICNTTIHSDHIKRLEHIHIDNITEKEQTLTKQLESIKDIESQFKLFSLTYKKNSEQVKFYDKEIKIINDELNKHRTKYIWSDLIAIDNITNTPDTLSKWRDKQYELNNVNRNLSEKIKNLTTEKQIALGLIDKIKDNIHSVNTKLSVALNIKQTLDKKFIITTSKDYENISDNDLEKKICNQNEFLKNIDITHTEILTKFHEHNNHNIALSTRLDIIKVEYEKIKIKIDKEVINLETKIANDSFLARLYDENQITEHKSSLATVTELPTTSIIETYKTIITKELDKNINIPKERGLIEEFFKKITIIEENIKTIEIKLKENVYDQHKHNEIKQLIHELETNKNLYIHRLGKLNERINNIKTKLEEKEKLKTDHANLNKRLYNLDLLLKLFHAKGFMQYISQTYIQNLCIIANKHFTKMNDNNMAIEFQDEQFLVRDYFNEGKIRSIKTLSGGQIFQASLSMAIALSDNLLLNTKFNKESFFFLDEGFGSLDKESINTVINTLIKLRKENRIIGVISHVEEIKEQMDDYININNTQELGSTITRAYAQA